MNQRQDSLTDQMRDLIPYAIERGMYDAADYINKVFPSKGVIYERRPMDAPPTLLEKHLKLVPKEGE